MMIQREDLQAAADAGVLNPLEIDGLLAFLRQRHGLLVRPAQANQRSGARFSGTHILYYLGGMLAITAVSLFTTIAVQALGMVALFVLSVLYALAAIGVAARLEKHGLGIPAGIFATLAIALAPLAVFALQHMLGMWSASGTTEHYRDFHRTIDWRWLVMELATLAVGALLLRRFRYAFLVMPIAVTLWYMGMDIVPALMLQAGEANGWFDGAAWELRKKIALAFGLIMLLMAFFVDLRSRSKTGEHDYAFWLYLFGLLTFCGSLSMMGSGGIAGKLVYLALHAGLVFIGAMLGRRTFAVFGGIGMAIVLGDLSWGMFKNSFAFVVVLSLLGFALIGMGIWWNKHEAGVTARLRRMLPADLRALLEARTP